MPCRRKALLVGDCGPRWLLLLLRVLLGPAKGRRDCLMGLKVVGPLLTLVRGRSVLRLSVLGGELRVSVEGRRSEGRCGRRGMSEMGPVGADGCLSRSPEGRSTLTGASGSAGDVLIPKIRSNGQLARARTRSEWDETHALGVATSADLRRQLLEGIRGTLVDHGGHARTA